jgi:hypothetical protein
MQAELELTREMQEEREAAYWDQFCTRPRTLRDVRLHARFPSTREFLRVLGDCRERTILELGCARGLLSVNLALSLNKFGWFRRESEDGHPLTRAEIDRFARPFDRVEVTIPYVELLRTLAYGQRPLSRFEPGLAALDRALCNPLTRSFSMARWIHAIKGGSGRGTL